MSKQIIGGRLQETRLRRARDRLEKLLPAKVAFDKPLAKLNTFRVGGPAAVFGIADTLHELKILTTAADDYELPWLLLGRGSNVLISDKGFNGLVVQLGREFQRLKVEGEVITAGAAVTLATLAQAALKHSLRGLTFTVGIPGTLGAAVAVNAGAYDRQMSDIVRRITVLNRDGKLDSLAQREIGFGYRTTALPPGTIILEGCLALEAGQSGRIKREMETNWRRRKENQPLGKPSAGSIFKNPAGDKAGRLIEEAGCKGWRVGGAMVSYKHANFIVNTGQARARDIYELIRRVRAAVAEQSGVELELEVKLIGDFSGGDAN